MFRKFKLATKKMGLNTLENLTRPYEKEIWYLK